MNRLRRCWDKVWLDALMVVVIFCVAGAVCELAFAWTTAM